MDPEFWLDKWRRNEIGFHESKPNVYLQRYWPRLHLSKSARVLVPLCGKSVDMLWLAQQGHRVLGVELSQLAVEAFFHEHGLVADQDEHGPFRRYRAGNIELLCGDFFDLASLPPIGITAVYDRAALIALPPLQRRRYGELLTRCFPEIAEMLLITLEYPQAQTSGPPFSVGANELAELYAEAFDVELLLRVDALAGNDRLRARGMTELHECVWKLVSR